MHTRIQALMDAEGLPYGRRTHTYNSRLAQELAKWAETKPGGEAVHDGLFRAYFVDGRNLGDPEVLVDVARSVGLPQMRPRTHSGKGDTGRASMLIGRNHENTA